MGASRLQVHDEKTLAVMVKDVLKPASVERKLGGLVAPAYADRKRVVEHMGPCPLNPFLHGPLSEPCAFSHGVTSLSLRLPSHTARAACKPVSNQDTAVTRETPSTFTVCVTIC